MCLSPLLHSTPALSDPSYLPLAPLKKHLITDSSATRVSRVRSMAQCGTGPRGPDRTTAMNPCKEHRALACLNQHRSPNRMVACACETRHLPATGQGQGPAPGTTRVGHPQTAFASRLQRRLRQRPPANRITPSSRSTSAATGGAGCRPTGREPGYVPRRCDRTAPGRHPAGRASAGRR